MESRDLLKEWKNRISAFKFRLGLANDKVFNDAINTEKVLRNFFNPSDYSISSRGIDQDNYLLYLLMNDHVKDVRLLNEMAELITFALSNNQVVALKASNKKVDHLGLSKALFEVFINKILFDKKFETTDNFIYTDSRGNKRPADNYFEFNDEKYLVECIRVSDSESLSLFQLNDAILRFLLKNKIVQGQEFRGFIGFKTDKNLAASIDDAKKRFLESHIRYLAAFNTKEDTIFIPKRYVSDEYDLEIMPYHMGVSFDEAWATKQYNALVSFFVEPYNSLRKGGLRIKGQRLTTQDRMNDKLFEKIKRKRTQHKDAEYNKIFFIEIDSTFGANPNNPMFSQITDEQLDTTRYNELIKKDDKTIFVFVFKKATDERITRTFHVLCDSKHQALIDKFNT